jgi:ABC-type multidrug transport system ATPase subunit
MTLLCAEGVSKSYGVRWAIKNLSLAVSQGEVVLLSGPNGAGKSTFLGCLSGLVRLSEGRVRLGGVSWDRRRRGLKLDTRIGVSLTAPFLYEALTLGENLAFFQHLSGGSLLLEQFTEGLRLKEHLKKRPGECSDGIRKRASLCRAFAGDPAIVFLDEPFAHLDKEGARSLMELLLQYRERGGAAVITVHEGEVVKELGSASANVRSVRLEQGRLTEEPDRGSV